MIKNYTKKSITLKEDDFNIVSSPIRWAGSKKTIIKKLLQVFPQNKNIYIEPFLGSGVVLLNLLKNRDLFRFTEYYVNDSNYNIITFYKYLQNRNEINALVRGIDNILNQYNNIQSIDEKSEFYYLQRERFNNDRLNDLNKCVVFFFLMKAGFNGVYRINSQGYFNVPFGKKEKINFDTQVLYKLGELVENVHFYSCDYCVFLGEIDRRRLRNCFVYCDPPYIPDDSSFYQKQMLYSKNTFNHEEFADKIMRTCKKNRWNLLISMSESKQARKIYSSRGYSKRTLKEVPRIINPSVAFKSKEIVFKNN